MRAPKQDKPGDWPRKWQADWLRLIYRSGRAHGLTAAEARKQARAAVIEQPPF